MKKLTLSLIIYLCIYGLLNAQTYSVLSPQKNINIQINANNNGALQYSVTFNGRQIIENSVLGFSFKNEPDLLNGIEVIQTIPSSQHEVWTPVVNSKHSQITNAYNELILITKEKNNKRRRMDIIFRVYDDGIAFRYKLFRNDTIGERYISKELTTFNIPGNPQAWVAEYICHNCPEGVKVNPNGNYATAQEGVFLEKRLDEVTGKTIAGLPFLMKYSNECWVAITEAEIINYPGFYIGTNGEKNQLTTKLAPLPNEKEEGVKAHFFDDFQTPWRVIMIGNSPGTLIESDIIQNLNPPCAIENPSWIKPGKCAWDHWWSGEVKMEMPVIKEYIDFASVMGWPYMLVDYHWYGEFNSPEANILKSIPQIDIHEIISYAKSKNVRIWIWLCSTDLNRNSAYKRAFPLYKEWGVAGVKIDFMDRDDQEMVRWYDDIVQTAAENELLVNFHGAFKPDGNLRTWPNNLTREGVQGSEFYHFSTYMTPEHNVNIAFTRMLAGPMDYTPGGFNNVTAENFNIQLPVLVSNTRAAELAKFVVYESPLQVICDHPRFILGEPGADFLKIVPTVWDDIKFLGGTPNEYVAIARQSDGKWFIGVLNNSIEKEITLDLSFLSPGRHSIEIWSDGKDASRNAKSIKKLTKTIESSNPLKVKLAKAGGYVAIIE